jgi:N-acetylmuramoyl-L-alanine amidase
MGINGRPEKETNLRVALFVEQDLKRRGIEVLMTRRDDRDVGLSERCQMANRWGADIFVSLHADAAGGPSAKGHHAIHSIHSQPGKGGNKLARLIVDQVTLATGQQPLPRGNGGVLQWRTEAF